MRIKNELKAILTVANIQGALDLCSAEMEAEWSLYLKEQEDLHLDRLLKEFLNK